MALQTPSTGGARRKSSARGKKRDDDVASLDEAGAASASEPRSRAASAGKLDGRLDPVRRRRLIAEAAYLRAERRGFLPGHEVEDWLAAEAEIDSESALGVDKAVL